jgi:hypothetical protein
LTEEPYYVLWAGSKSAPRAKPSNIQARPLAADKIGVLDWLRLAFDGQGRHRMVRRLGWQSRETHPEAILLKLYT